MLSSEIDPWSLNTLQLDDSKPKSFFPDDRFPIPRHGSGEPFLRGPIPWNWIATACRLPGSGLHAALTVRFLCCRFPGPNRWGLETLSRGWGVHPRSARRALHQAKAAGVIAIQNAPGRKLVVSIPTAPLVSQSTGHPPLKGPIPWSWLRPALLLPGAAVQTACACWLQAESEQSGEFKLRLNGWRELGLSRYSMSRGLETLASANLLSVEKRAGHSPLIQLICQRKRNQSAQLTRVTPDSTPRANKTIAFPNIQEDETPLCVIPKERSRSPLDLMASSLDIGEHEPTPVS